MKSTMVRTPTPPAPQLDIEKMMSEREEMLRKWYKKNKVKENKCSVQGCGRLCDVTELGLDTSCSYHRLLFDWWAIELDNVDFTQSQKGRRNAFTRWRNTMGKKLCDDIVRDMMAEPINWRC